MATQKLVNLHQIRVWSARLAVARVDQGFVDGDEKDMVLRWLALLDEGGAEEGTEKGV